HFVRRISGEADGVKAQSSRGLRSRVRSESAMLVDQVNDRFRQDNETDGRRYRQQQDKPDGMGERRTKLARVTNGGTARNQRQTKAQTKSNPDSAKQWELHD